MHFHALVREWFSEQCFVVAWVLLWCSEWFSVHCFVVARMLLWVCLGVLSGFKPID